MLICLLNINIVCLEEPNIGQTLKYNPLRFSLPLDACKLIHISFSTDVVHSILCLNLLLLIMNHTILPESGYEVASCLLILSSEPNVYVEMRV